MKEATTRDDLMQYRDQLYTVLGALEGTGPEMTDREAALVIARAIWATMDFLVRKTWGT